jgi:hypothetical protein
MDSSYPVINVSSATVHELEMIASGANLNVSGMLSEVSADKD